MSFVLVLIEIIINVWKLCVVDLFSLYMVMIGCFLEFCRYLVDVLRILVLEWFLFFDGWRVMILSGNNGMVGFIFVFVSCVIVIMGCCWFCRWYCMVWRKIGLVNWLLWCFGGNWCWMLVVFVLIFISLLMWIFGFGWCWGWWFVLFCMSFWCVVIWWWWRLYGWWWFGVMCWIDSVFLFGWLWICCCLIEFVVLWCCGGYLYGWLWLWRWLCLDCSGGCIWRFWCWFYFVSLFMFGVNCCWLISSCILFGCCWSYR